MKSFLKYKKYILLQLVISIVIVFFHISYENMLSDAITCISIVFAFSQTFIFTAYSNARINEYMKDHGMLEKFIIDNRRFLGFSLFSLLMLFLISIFSFSYKFYCFYVSNNHLILFIVTSQLNLTMAFLHKYMNFYKNSYSNRLMK